MRTFVAERLVDGKWEPWYMRKTTFRRALQLSCQDASKDSFRLRRITQEECDVLNEDVSLFIHHEG